VRLALFSAVVFLAAQLPCAHAVEQGTIDFTGNLSRTSNFNPFGPSLYGTFGTMTVSHATGVFAGLSGVLSMSTAQLVTGLTGAPLMTWMIGGFTIATTYVSVAGGEPWFPVGVFSITGHGLDLNYQLWDLGHTLPPLGGTGTVTLHVGVFDATQAVPESGSTMLLLLCVVGAGALTAVIAARATP
jgi:hypothetical protein